jgi:hypothetical protein
MAKLGRPAKPGPRYPSGDLKPVYHQGTTRLLAHRAALVGCNKADDPRAGYPLGILHLCGLISGAEHGAGLRYARLHDLVFGRGLPSSPLAKVMAGIARGVAAANEPHRVKRLIAAADHPERLQRLREAGEELDRANAVLLGLSSRRPYHVLQNIAVYEREMRFMDTSRSRSRAAWAADQRDLDALREATGALARHWVLRHDGEEQAAD